MIVRVRDGVKVRPEAFGALIFTNRTPILALNEDAYAVWKLIDGRRNVEQIAGELAGRFNDTARIRALVDEFVCSCIALGLVICVDDEQNSVARSSRKPS